MSDTTPGSQHAICAFILPDNTAVSTPDVLPTTHESFIMADEEERIATGQDTVRDRLLLHRNRLFRLNRSGDRNPLAPNLSHLRVPATTTTPHPFLINPSLHACVLGALTVAYWLAHIRIAPHSPLNPKLTTFFNDTRAAGVRNLAKVSTFLLYVGDRRTRAGLVDTADGQRLRGYIVPSMVLSLPPAIYLLRLVGKTREGDGRIDHTVVVDCTLSPRTSRDPSIPNGVFYLSVESLTFTLGSATTLDHVADIRKIYVSALNKRAKNKRDRVLIATQHRTEAGPSFRK